MCLDREEECCCSDAQLELRQEVLNEIVELHSTLEQHLTAAKELMEEVFDKIYQVSPGLANLYWPNIDSLSNLDGYVSNSMSTIRKELQ